MFSACESFTVLPASVFSMVAFLIQLNINTCFEVRKSNAGAESWLFDYHSLVWQRYLNVVSSVCVQMQPPFHFHLYWVNEACICLSLRCCSSRTKPSGTVNVLLIIFKRLSITLRENATNKEIEQQAQNKKILYHYTRQSRCIGIRNGKSCIKLILIKDKCPKCCQLCSFYCIWWPTDHFLCMQPLSWLHRVLHILSPAKFKR